MSKHRNGETDDESNQREYNEALDRVDTSINEITRKIERGRIRDTEKENARVKYHRALGYLERTRLKILEQRDIDERVEEINERLEEMEQKNKYQFK